MKTFRILLSILLITISISSSYSIGFPINAKKKKMEKVENNKKEQTITDNKLLQSVIIFKEIIQKIYFSR